MKIKCLKVQNIIFVILILFEIMLARTWAETRTGIDMATYEKVTASFYYRVNASDAWTLITDDTTNIPGNAQIEQVLSFSGLDVDVLKANGWTLYYQIPEGFISEVVTDDPILQRNDDGTYSIIGRLNVDASGFGTMVYDSSALTGQYLAGSVAFVEQVDPDYIRDNQLTIGTGTISVNLKFEDDASYKYANLDLEKTAPTSIISTSDGYFLEYSIKVTANNNIELAYVIDSFDDSSKGFIESYVGVGDDETSTNSSSASISPTEMVTNDDTVKLGQINDTNGLLWTLRNLNKGDSRTLTYRAKLSSSYILSESTQTLVNNADVYSSSSSKPTVAYLRDSATASYAAKVRVAMTKSVSSMQTDASGRNYVDYTVKVTSTSSYPLFNLTLYDYFGSDLYTTGRLEYDLTSFKWGSTAISSDNIETGISGSDYYFRVTIPQLNSSNKLTYRVYINPITYTSINGGGSYTNYARLSNENNVLLKSASCTLYDIYKQWQRKLSPGEPLSSDKTITMSDGSTFTVNAGAYMYNVVVNEDGKWEVSDASFNDSITNMLYTGYVQIDAYDVSGVSIDNSSNSTALASVKTGILVKTKWANIDSLSTFSLGVKDLGLDGAYAYVLTYYALPTKSTTTLANNNFCLTGTVGYGGKYYTLAINYINYAMTVVGSKSCDLSKQAWYYNLQGTGGIDYYTDWTALMWVIKATGDITDDLTIRDNTVSNTIMRSDSLIGVYVGPNNLVFDNTNTVYDLDSMGLTKLVSGTDYKTSNNVGKGNDTLDVKFLRDCSPSKDSAIYIIVKTRMYNKTTSTNVTANWKATNRAMYYYSDAGSWVPTGDQDIVVNRYKGSRKTVAGVYEYDGTNFYCDDELVTLPSVDSTDGGLYVGWYIDVNCDGSLSGTAQIDDIIPDGLDLQYVQLASIGSWLGGYEPTAKTPDKDLTGYTEYSMKNLNVYNYKNGSWNNIGGGKVMDSEKYYYNPDTREVCWSVGNLRNTSINANYYVRFFILCKVTDIDFMEQDAEKTYTNVATVLASSGVNNLSSDVTVTNHTLSKTGDTATASKTGIYMFEIEANTLSQDLDPDSDKIVVVDEMNSSLIFKEKTLKITRSDGTLLSKDEYSISTEHDVSSNDTLLKFTIPDGEKLTISYSVQVNAAPNRAVSISNKAYFEGYSSGTESTVANSSFSYSVSAVASTYNTYATLYVNKVDSETRNPLSGATFVAFKVTLDSDNHAILADTPSFTVSDSIEGVYTFNKLDYNTIYCVFELDSPKGYYLNAERRYISIANTERTNYSAYLDTLDEFAAAGIGVESLFTSDSMEITIADAPHEYTLPEAGVKDSFTRYSIFIALSSIGVYLLLRQYYINFLQKQSQK